MAKISVIIPIYNVENYLEACLSSIVNQTFKDIEIICINDGSTDKSKNILNRYAKKDNRVIMINKKNEGLSIARNIGIDKATGEYIMFVDSDDTLEKECVEEVLKHTSNTQLCICKLKKHYNGIDNSANKKLEESTIKLRKNNFFKAYCQKTINGPVCKLYDRKIVKENNIKFIENLSLGEDLLFNLEYIKHINSIVILEKELYNYRLGNSNSLGQKYYPNMLWIQNKLMEKILEVFANVDEEILLAETLKYITTPLSNELRNSNINIIKRYFNMRKLAKSEYFQIEIKKRKSILKKWDYFLLKNKLYILYLIRRRVYKYE